MSEQTNIETNTGSGTQSTAKVLVPGKTALVTGGGGFLGKAIVKQLLEKGMKVRSFSRGAYPELEKMGVECFRGEISDPAAVEKACAGCDLVFHVAAKPGIWGPYEEYERINYRGTETVVNACKKLKVPRLIYTSSPSVVFNGQDMQNADETVPYPDHYEAHYPKTKAMAEKLVLAANSAELATTSLRPHLIWGPGDKHLVPRLVKAAREGRLKKVGEGTNKVDAVYVDNAAEAHLQAAEHLEFGKPPAGKAYFITNDDPRLCWDIVNSIIGAAGLPPLTSSINQSVAWVIGWAMETVYGLAGWKEEPRMTRFLANELATHHWFNIAAAKRDFGYQPRISMEEGMKRLADWYKQNPNA
ncbi:MAG TPA: NAD-dependent epimerase/dehydratase family protein [Candidatus Ozemobacteraceae bacterium]|nr:NAD-dependent epimerase/dehydratase family protein [Candidatus Ozemobacteraceae bacterium]